MNFVRRIQQFIENKMPQVKLPFVLVDLPESTQKPPAVTDGFHPDLYYRHNGILIIGEAKTVEDVERRHSKLQYDAYFRECESFNGEKYIVVSSAWSIAMSFRTILKHLKRANNYSSHIIVVSEEGIPELYA